MKPPRSPLDPRPLLGSFLASVLEPLLRRFRDRPLSRRELQELEAAPRRSPGDPLTRFFTAYRTAEPAPRPFEWPVFWARLEREALDARTATRSAARSRWALAQPAPRLFPRLAPLALGLALLVGVGPALLPELTRLGSLFQRAGSGEAALDVPTTMSAVVTGGETGGENAFPNGEPAGEGEMGIAGGLGGSPLPGGPSTPGSTPGNPDDGASGGADPTEALAELTAARERWARAGAGGAVPSRYSFALTRVCYCLPEWSGPFQIAVRDGVSTVIRLADDGSGGEGAGEPITDPEILAALPLSAEALFRFIEERIGQEGFRAAYDERTGLPLSFWSDPIPGAADDELGLLIEGITVER